MDCGDFIKSLTDVEELHKIGPASDNKKSDVVPLTGKARSIMAETIQQILMETLDECFKYEDTYNSINKSDKIHEILKKVRDQLISLDLKRYKHVIYVQIVEDRGQALNTENKSNYNHNTDFMCFTNFSLPTLFCCVQVSCFYVL